MNFYLTKYNNAFDRMLDTGHSVGKDDDVSLMGH